MSSPFVDSIKALFTWDLEEGDGSITESDAYIWPNFIEKTN